MLFVCRIDAIVSNQELHGTQKTVDQSRRPKCEVLKIIIYLDTDKTSDIKKLYEVLTAQSDDPV